MTITARADTLDELSLPRLSEPVADELREVEIGLEQLVTPAAGGLAPVVYRHVLQAGGKRLRPLLVLLSCQAAGGEPREAIGLAGAAEIIHLSSLVHDDVIDEAHERRGQASVPERWGNRISILLGDLLIGEIFRRLADEQGRQALGVLAETVVVMCQAELADSPPGQGPSEETYLANIRGKTAALMAASCELGARAAGNDAAIAPLRSYGLHLGLAFQIADDLLDLYGDPQRLGKPVFQDLARGQWTLPVIAALREASDGQRERLLGLVEGVRAGGVEMAPEAAHMVETLGGRDYATARAEAIAQDARAALAVLAPSPARQSLEGLTRYVLRRGL